jgi:NDP-sugar pyrophosphorylase family protein
METTLVILAAGLGSRFGGNKQISHVGPHGEILMEYSIYDAIAAGFTHVVFILKQEMVEQVRSTVGDKIAHLVDVAYAVQSTEQLPSWYTVPADRTKPFGTVHAVLCAKDLIHSPFATVNADDYYGKEAFRIMHGLLTSMASKAQAGMVPYILGNTMSENGGVTRGICHIKQNLLQGVLETHDIQYNESREIVGEFGKLQGDEMVSMNIWGFHPDLLEDMQEYFEKFLKSLTPEEIKKECLLPVMVNDFLADKKLSLRAIPSSDRWFGITYQADRESVAKELEQLHNKGCYPPTLYQ